MKQKLSRILMTLAALFMVAAGAWAQVNVAPAGSQGNQWTFQMPASNVQLRVNYYALPELAWRQAQTQTPVQDPVTGYVGFESLTAFPALHNPHTLSPIRYVSTNPAAATINEEGIVTFVDPGTTTIRAVFDGDNDYQEDSVAYVLNVLAPCTLTLAQNEPNWGSVTLAGTTDSVKALENGTYHVVPGKVVTVNATANELHHVAGWKDENGNDLATATYSSYFVTNPTMMFPANSTLTFTVTGDTTATAMFGINSYEVSADVADGQSGRGMVHISYTDVQGNPHTTAAGQSATASAQGGSTSTLVATPADGYHFVCWTNGNDTLGTNATLTTNVALAATAEFDTNTYVLTVAVADGQSDRGTVAGSTTAKHFLSYEISATPNTGYHFTQWSDGDTDNPRTVTLTCDSTFTAVFDTNTYVLTVAVADGQSDRGTVAGSTTAKHFLTYEISATPNTGYHFTQWSDGNTDNPRTVTLTRDSTFTAEFDTNTYVLTVAVADGQSDRGTVAGSTTAKHFLSYEISATPNTGYHFTQWSDGNTDNPRTVTLTCDSTFIAVFDTNTYVLTVAMDDGQSDRGTVAGSTTAKHFLTYEISATPSTGYHFTQWSDGNTDNPRTVTLTRDSTFTAVFDTNTYVLTVVVADGQSDRGTVAGSTTAKHFLTYEISATPNTGYHFTQWSDGNADNPRTVTLTCDSTFTAEFEPNIYTIIYMDWETALDTVTYKYRDNIAEYIPQHGGRTFLGWLPAVPVTMPAEDLTVSAQWSCDPVTHDGHEYSAVLIGGLCWTAENLRATHYADGTEITNIYRYQSAMSPDMAGNASTYGLLYDWYDAVNAERPTKAAHVQGICPDNWRLPNEEDFAMLSSMNLHSLRSTDYWVSNNGSNTTGFDIRPAGMYNISTSRYEDLHSSAYFWSVDAAGATEAHCHEANYYCETFLHHIRNKGNAFSVRCVRD